MALVARGDEAAFERLYDAIAGPVFGLVQRVLRDPAQSEEVAQEVLVELWRTATRYRSELGSVRTWALTLAHRRAVDRVRRAVLHAVRMFAVATTRRHVHVRERGAGFAAQTRIAAVRFGAGFLAVVAADAQLLVDEQHVGGLAKPLADEKGRLFRVEIDDA